MKIQAFVSIKEGKKQIVSIYSRIGIVIKQSMIGGQSDDGNVGDDRRQKKVKVVPPLVVNGT